MLVGDEDDVFPPAQPGPAGEGKPQQTFRHGVVGGTERGAAERHPQGDGGENEAGRRHVGSESGGGHFAAGISFSV